MINPDATKNYNLCPNSSLYCLGKKEVYVTQYGTNFSAVTFTPHYYIDNPQSIITASRAPIPMSYEQRAYERIKKACRRIKDAILANNFSVMAIITWRAKYKRCDPDLQNAELRIFFRKLRKKYPDVKIFAIRHKNPGSKGYHVHVLFEKLPRKALRIKKGKTDNNGRQTYYLLGWSRKGWASAEFVENLEGIARYFSQNKKIALLPEGVHSIVYRGRNLTPTKRNSCGMTDAEIRTILSNICNIKESHFFFVERGNGYKEKLLYILTEGSIQPHLVGGGAAD